jgi:hypothetical protein
MEMRSSTVHTKTITMEPHEVSEHLEASAREGKFMNFIPPAEASVSATILPNGGAQIVVTYADADTGTGT